MKNEQLSGPEAASLYALLTQRATRAENNLKQTLAPFRAALINGTFANLTPGTLRLLTEYTHDLSEAIATLRTALDDVEQCEQTIEPPETEVVVFAPTEPPIERVLKGAFKRLLEPPEAPEL